MIANAMSQFSGIDVVILIVAVLAVLAYVNRSKIKAKLSSAKSTVAADVKAVEAKVVPHAKSLAVVGTTAEPAPAAPAASVAVAPPPTAAPTGSPSASAAAVGGGGTAWPQVVEADGIHLLASAPINPAWKVDQDTKTYDNAHSFGFEPSNGGKCVPPQPLRSPAGYPLFYAIGAGNAPVGAPSVIYNGNSFPDDAAVAAYIAAVASAHAADDVAAAAAAAQVFAGPVPVSALTKDDLRFLWWADANPATPKLHNWAYTVLSGSRRDIQVALASVSEDIAWLGHYDATKYAGVLRPYYDAAVKA